MNNPAILPRHILLQRLALGFSYWQAADVDGMLSMATDDVVVRTGFRDNYPRGAEARGQESCRAVLKEILTSYKTVSNVFERIVVDGNKVAFRRLEQVRKRGGGPTVEIRFCSFVEFRGDKICFLEDFTDAVALRQLAAEELQVGRVAG